LLHHDSEDVRFEVLKRIEERRVEASLERVREMLGEEISDRLRGRAVRVAGALSEEIFPEVMEAMHHPSPELRRGALVGLLKSGSIEGIVYAGAELLDDLRSDTARDRIFAAQVLRDAEIPSFYRQAIQLMNDTDLRVRAAAIQAAATMGHPPLWPLVVEALREHELAGEASQALLEAGEEAVPSLLYGFERHKDDTHFQLAVLRILGLIGSAEAGSYLADLVHTPEPDIRHAALRALQNSGFRLDSVREKSFRIQLRSEVGEVARLWSVRAELGRKLSGHPLLVAIDEEIQRGQHRVFLLIAPLFPGSDVQGAWESFRSGDRTRRAYALEFLENCISNEDRVWIFPALEDLPEAERVDRLSRLHDVERMSPADRVQWVCEEERLSRWTRICARKAATELDLAQRPLNEDEDLVYERTLRLREVQLFEEMTDHVLAGIAPRMQPVEIPADGIVFHEGDVGDCIYLVLEGRLKVLKGNHKLAELDQNSIFGEFTILHSGRRTASVIAETDTRLFRFTQADLYDLLSEESAVARPMIRLIVKRLQENMATRANVA